MLTRLRRRNAATARSASFGLTEVAAYVESLSIAGVNIEDSSAEKLIDPGVHEAKVTAIKDANTDMSVNARIDTCWLDQQADTTLQRAHEYAIAGADSSSPAPQTPPNYVDLRTISPFPSTFSLTRPSAAENSASDASVPAPCPTVRRSTPR